MVDIVTARKDRWSAERLKAIKGLPGHLRPAAWCLIGFDGQGKAVGGRNIWQKTAENWRMATADLEAMGASDRGLIFEAIVPRIAAHVEASWQKQKSLPYQTSISRRAFRAPHRPDLTLRRRGDWLSATITLASQYDEDVIWLAQNGAAISQGWMSSGLGLLFAATIDSPDPAGDRVFETLMAIAGGDTTGGSMGRHVIRGLLSASRPAGWEMVERLLLAAQRQEGLRQVILETVDEVHPTAFERIFHLIREHDLARFSSVVRAMGVWFGMNWQADEARALRSIIAQTDDLLGDEEARQEALARAEADPQMAYQALCLLAFEDVEPAVVQARPLLAHEDAGVRFMAAGFLSVLRLPEALEALAPLLMDDDLRVATMALKGMAPSPYVADGGLPTDLFERLERSLPRFPARKRTLEPLVWPWLILTSERRDAAEKLLNNLGDRPFKRLLPYVPAMSPGLRARVATMIGEEELVADAEARACLFDLLGDRSLMVRQAAVKVAAGVQINEEEARQLEGYLTRKSGDLRRGVLRLLLNQEDNQALASAGRLLAAKGGLQRQAGLELLRELKEEERVVEDCRTLAKAYAASGRTIPDDQQRLLDAILDRQGRPFTLEDGLALFDPAQRTPLLSPKARNGRLFRRKSWVTKATANCLASLDELVHQYHDTPVTVQFGQGQREELLANANWSLFRMVLSGTSWTAPESIQLEEVWQGWSAGRPTALRDDDGLELLRALAPLEAGTYRLSHLTGPVPGWFKKGQRTLYNDVDGAQLHYPPVVQQVLWWLVLQSELAGAADYLLNAAETSLTLLPSPELESGGYRISQLLGWLRLAQKHRDLKPGDWSGAEHIRLWHITRWLVERGLSDHINRSSIDDTMRAFHAGGANETDILAMLIGPRPETKRQYSWGGGYQFRELSLLSSRYPEARFSQFAEDATLQEMVDRCRGQIVVVEVVRGDIPTAASRPAMALRHSGGLDELTRLLRALGREAFLRGWTYDSLSKKSVFSRLIRVTYPDEADTPERFAGVMARAGISRKRLIETALYVPQWAAHVEAALDQPDFAEAVWWFHAHTKDHRWMVDQAIRSAWQVQVDERTPLSGQTLLDGAVDVAWFKRIYAALGEERWREIDRAAKYASGGGGHKRAQLFADAMTGRLDEDELIQRIRQKRHQDSVRALGLLPLPEGAGGDALILERYLLIQEFLRGRRKFGSQRQASEKLAARIGMENLARTADYADPQRLEWAMEAQAVADLADGAVTVTAGDVSVTLAIDEWGAPQIKVVKNGRQLKAVPRKLKKQEEIAGLLARKKEIKQQASRARLSLEAAMCRGDVFSTGELQELLRHPVLSPMLGQLVFVGVHSGDGLDKMGYPVGVGQGLERFDGEVKSLQATDRVRIAHAHDLLLSGDWHFWQRECFRRERIQPFKQVFRELYVLTAGEQDEHHISRRYAGHQVNPRQALALFGQRGWVSHPEEGIRRTDHDEGLVAWVDSMGLTFTPADVEGITIEGVHFTPRGQWQAIALESVPARLFSEVMRDVDLVVSVAHQGGVDPEVTASTTEMRAALIRETCAMLKLDNVRMEKSHVLIDGQLNNYSVHLGSGVVHQQPGGALCLVPVHSQHRGRIFLPFADDDPKTAEVVAKVLLLAQDEKIKDPTILEQILPG